MEKANISHGSKRNFTIETLTQLAFYNGFSIYRSKFSQIYGAILICGVPDSNMLDRIIQDKTKYHIIIPDEDCAKELKYYFELNEANNIHIYDCSADEIPFEDCQIKIAFLKQDTLGLNSNFYSEMYRYLNLEARVEKLYLRILTSMFSIQNFQF